MRIKSMLKNKRFGIIAAIGVFLLLAGLSQLLLYGNPQWHKYIYMFQAYVYPKTKNIRNQNYSWIAPPKKYTGVWRTWCKDGSLAAEENYLNGMHHGPQYSYYSNGRVSNKMNRDNGALVGREIGWDENGIKVVERYYYDDGSFSQTGLYPSGKKKSYLYKPDLEKNFSFYKCWDKTGALEKIEVWGLSECIERVTDKGELKKNGMTKNDYDILFAQNEQKMLLASLIKKVEMARKTKVLKLFDSPIRNLTFLKKMSDLNEITSLDLSYSNNLTSLEGVQCLIGLAEINLRNCEKLVSIEALKNCNKLVKLDLGFSRSLPKLELDELQRTLPNCEVNGVAGGFK